MHDHTSLHIDIIVQKDDLQTFLEDHISCAKADIIGFHCGSLHIGDISLSRTIEHQHNLAPVTHLPPWVNVVALPPLNCNCPFRNDQ